jgi:hypothetical protein
MNKKFTSVIALLFTLAVATVAKSQSIDSIRRNFIAPPSSAKPRVWWHWMDGNITKDGIRKDLLWMERAGIGGFQNFDAAQTTPQRVKKRLVYMEPEWVDAFHYTTKLADSLKLEMAIAGSPGWSQSGGPWVQPKDGMKKLVWSETYITGGQTVKLTLPKPPGVTGPFQNIPFSRLFGLETETNEPTPQYGQDVAVIAYKLPETDIPMRALHPVITSSGGSFTLKPLTDGDLATKIVLPADTISGFAWIGFAFDRVRSIQAVFIASTGGNNKILEKSDDGVNFQFVADMSSGDVYQTQNIPAATAKYFRIRFKNSGAAIAEIVLHTIPRVTRFADKAGFTVASELYRSPTPTTEGVITTENVVDITNTVDSNGTLNWTAPPGNWNIIRFGYSLIGRTNHPASAEATGLEVDKLDPVAVSNYFHLYFDQYKKATRSLMGIHGPLRYLITDSWEVGAQNWTGNMLNEFQKRRGYSIVPWMPVFTGHIVKSAEASDNFLWDFRKTLQEMMVEYHYDKLTDILKEYGMQRYSESHEFFRALIADGMDVKRTAAIPMGALWMQSNFPFGGAYCHRMDLRESASVAHIYGQNIAAAESFTTIGEKDNAYGYDPQTLKPAADIELANGINRFVIHTSVHQPTDDKPGFTLGPCGQWFTRNETWAEQAKAWTSYLSRSSYLLQQGKFVADIVYYYGEDDNITNLFGNTLPNIPEGYNYDFINPDALINLLEVKDGKLVTPSGMRYRVLVLGDNARRMSLPVLRKLHKLVLNGATITGGIPERSPSLADDTVEFKRLVNEIWNAGNPRVFHDKEAGEVLKAVNVVPDFSYAKSTAGTQILFVHRKLPDRDVYWVNNREDTTVNLMATFRITGKVPQVWHPETGIIENTSYTIADGVTKVELHLQPADAVFVVFKDKATKLVVKIPAVKEKTLATLTGNWKISFPSGWGAPVSIKMDSLTSWTMNHAAGIKYFSGTAIYTKSMNVSAAWLKKGSTTWLDLGDVKNIAEVIVNGTPVSIVWKKPFRVDISSVIKPGENMVEIRATNLWVNRVIGDAQPNALDKYTYATWNFVDANSPLLSSGLLGPVKLVSISY